MRPRGHAPGIIVSPHVPQVLRLRQRGMTFAEIGRRLGITRQGAHDMFRRHARPASGETVPSPSPERKLDVAS